MSELFKTLERTESASLRIIKRKDGASGPRANLVDHEAPMPVMICSDSAPDFGLKFLTSLISVSTSPVMPTHVAAGAILSMIGMYRDDSRGILSNITSRSNSRHTIYEVNDFRGRVPVLSRRQERDETMMGIMGLALTDRKYYDGSGFRGGKKLALSTSSAHTGPTGLSARIRAAIVQTIVLLIKSVTNPEGAKPSEDRRLQQFINSGDVEDHYLLETREAKLLQKVISTHLGLRKSLVSFVQMSSELGESGGRIPQIVAKLSHYIRGTGLAGYHMVKRWGIATRLPSLADRGLRADLTRFQQLMKLELKLGEEFQYMALNDNPHAGAFAPGCYVLLWSFSVGVAAVLDKEASNLTVNKALLNTKFFQNGKKAASAAHRGLDIGIADALGLNKEEIERTRNMMAGRSTRRGNRESDSDSSDSEGEEDAGPSGSANNDIERPVKSDSKRQDQETLSKLEAAAAESDEDEDEESDGDDRPPKAGNRTEEQEGGEEDELDRFTQ